MSGTVARDAQKFLNSMLAAMKFAQAVVDYELNDAMIGVAKSELDSVKNDILKAKTELNELRAERMKVLGEVADAEMQADQIKDDAAKEAQRMFSVGSVEADKLLAQARVRVEQLESAAKADLAQRQHAHDILEAAIAAKMTEMAKIEKALADMKKKFS